MGSNVNLFNTLMQPQGLQGLGQGGSGAGMFAGALPGFDQLNQNGASPLGFSGLGQAQQQQFANDPIAQLGLQSMSPDTQMLFFSLQTMMVGLMAMIASTLAGILSGAISGTAPAGTGAAAGQTSQSGASAPGGGGEVSQGTPGATGLASPLSGDVSGNSGDFGPRVPPTAGASSDHKGVDIARPEGTPIMSAGAGTVESISPNAGGAGNMIVIDHGNGVKTRYLHMSADGFGAGLKVGDTVNQGQTIGKVGNTGTSTGAHLHFEVLVNGVAQDPVDHIPAFA